MACDEDPLARTLVDRGVRGIWQELKQVPMTMAGGVDVDRQHMIIHYVGNDGLLHRGQIRSDTRKTLRRWLAEYCPEVVTSSLEGCTS